MNNFMLRPRPLKAGHLRTNVIAGGSSVLVGTGWGTKMIITPQRDEFFTTYHGWTAALWRVLVPGIYRIVRTADGGGGGGAKATASPGVVRNGFGGKRGAQNTVSALLKGSSLIRVGTGGVGGSYPSGTNGSSGYGVTLSGIGSSPAPGVGGDGGTDGNPATEGQRLGEIGHGTPGSGIRGGGGDGGNSATLDGWRGSTGDLYLELVG